MNSIDEVIDFIKDIKCPPYRIEAMENPHSGIITIRVLLQVTDVYNPGTRDFLMKWDELQYDSYKYMTKENISKRIYNLIEDMAIHEVKEWFSVNGERIYDPHQPEIFDISANLSF